MPQLAVLRLVLLFAQMLAVRGSGITRAPATPQPGVALTPKAPRSEAHVAPHGGTLVQLGDEFAHLEFVFDSRHGRVTVYVLDRATETPTRLEAEPMGLYVASMRPRGAGPPHSWDLPRLWLAPVDRTTDDHGVAWATTFAGEAVGLRGLTAFEAMLPLVLVKGTAFRGVTFRVESSQRALIGDRVGTQDNRDLPVGRPRY